MRANRHDQQPPEAHRCPRIMNGLYVLISSSGARLGWVDKRALTDIIGSGKIKDVASAVVVAYGGRHFTGLFDRRSAMGVTPAINLLATSTDYLGDELRL